MNIEDILMTLDLGPHVQPADEALSWIGRHLGAEPARPVEIRSALDDTVLARVPEAGGDAVGATVAAAGEALGTWRRATPAGRAGVLRAAAARVRKQAGLLSMLQTLETGLPIRVSRDSVLRAAAALDHHAAWAAVMPEVFAHREGWGVAAVLADNTPLPVLSLARRIAPQLAAGNAAVLAAQTPLTAFALAASCHEAGLPAGILQVLSGSDLGTALATHSGVDMIALSGNGDAAVRREAAASGKGLSEVASDTATFVICADADFDAAAEAVAVYTQGLAPAPRLLVQEGIADRFAARLADRWSRLIVGAPLDHRTDLAAPGAPMPVPATFRTPDEAAVMGRGAPAASIWSEGLGLALELAMRVRAGTVWINGADTEKEDGRASIEACLRPSHQPLTSSEGTELDFSAVSDDTLGDRDPRLFIGGKPVRGAGNYAIHDAEGRVIALAARAGRAEASAAVAAAAGAAGWSRLAVRDRSRALISMAETLDQRHGRLTESLRRLGGPADAAAAKVTAAIAALRLAASLAETSQDGGARADAQQPALTLTLSEPWGTAALVCHDGVSLSSLAGWLGALLAAGNRVVTVAPPRITPAIHELFAGSDLPAGTLNLLGGDPAEVADLLAGEPALDALWLTSPALCNIAGRAATGPMNPILAPRTSLQVLRAASRIRTLWLPYGA